MMGSADRSENIKEVTPPTSKLPLPTLLPGSFGCVHMRTACFLLHRCA